MLQLVQVLSTTAPDTHIISTLFTNTSAYGKNIEQGERVAIALWLMRVVATCRWLHSVYVNFSLPDSNFLQLVESLEDSSPPCSFSPANESFCESVGKRRLGKYFRWAPTAPHSPKRPVQIQMRKLGTICMIHTPHIQNYKSFGLF